MLDGRVGELGAAGTDQDGPGDTGLRGDICDNVSGASLVSRLFESMTTGSGTAAMLHVGSGSIFGPDTLSGVESLIKGAERCKHLCVVPQVMVSVEPNEYDVPK